MKKKKAYITPYIEEVKLKGMYLLSGSGVQSSGDANGINWGGEDPGDLDPQAPGFSSCEPFSF